jgi:hypothetical protein
VAAQDFAIEITRLGWIDPDLEDASGDPCSHGDIRLEIGGQVIVPGDGEHWYTVSTSALALLRTLESDHSREQPVAERLVFHCGMLEMMGCPIGIDWTVTHVGARVQMQDVVRCDEVDGTGATFPGLVAEVDESEYRRTIVRFAEKAKEPFVGLPTELPGTHTKGSSTRASGASTRIDWTAPSPSSSRRPRRP